MKLLRSYRIFFLSIGIAFLMWFYVKLTSTFTHTIDIPFQVINVKPGFGIVSDLPETIPVIFEADGKTLLGIKFFYDVRYQLDLAQFKDNPVIYPANFVQNIKMPAKTNVKILEIAYHDTVEIRSEHLVTKKVPIVPAVDVSCAPGYIWVGGFRLHPDSVVVECPASLAELLTEIKATAKPVYNLTEDRTITLEPMPSKNKFIHAETVDRITASLDIQPLGETVMDNLPVRLINVPHDLNAIVQPSTFSIRIRSGVDFLASLPKDSVRGVIDYALEQSLNRVEPQITIHVPRDVSWSQVTPSRFKLVILNESIP